MPRVTRQPSNSVRDRPGRLKLLLRRQRRMLRPLGWAACAGLVAVLVATIGSASLPGGDTLASLRERLGAAAAMAGMRVTDIRIEGRANTPEPLLRAALGVSIGAPTLGFSLAAARTRIETLSWVDHATVERELPGTVVVSLDERRPFAIWQHDGRFALIDRDGQVVAGQDIARFRDLPLVVGVGAPAAATTLLDALRDRPAIFSHMTAAVRVGARRWNLQLANGDSVMLPEGHVVPALDRLALLQQQHALLDRPLAAIDMRLPDRLVLRPPPPDGPPAPPANTAAKIGPKA